MILRNAVGQRMNLIKLIHLAVSIDTKPYKITIIESM